LIVSAALRAHSKVDAPAVSDKFPGQILALGFFSRRRDNVMKFLIAAGATLAMVTVASAADLPRPQPVVQQPVVGKMPIGKGPIGKGPVGKGPVVARY
jgi:hypothetical protein